MKGRVVFKFIVQLCLWMSVLGILPGGGGALPYKPIRDVPFFRVSFFSINSLTGYEN